MAELQVRVRNIARASAEEHRTGLIAYLALEYGAFAFDSVCLRRTADSRFVLSYPQRRDRGGRAHAYVRPLSDPERREIERQVLSQLNIEDLLAPEGRS